MEFRLLPGDLLALELSDHLLYEDTVDGRVRLSLSAETGVVCDALFPVVCIRNFAASLQRLHRDLRGKAELVAETGVASLCFEVRDAGRGRIVLSGRLELLPEVGDGALTVTFGDLETDQSYLPALISGVKRYLRQVQALG